VLDARYTHGKFRFVSGDNGAAPPTINDPADTGLQDIDPLTDEDPELFSYLNGSNPRAMLVNITTDFSTKPATSKGKYTACVPSASGTTFVWDYLKDPNDNPLAKDIALKYGSGDVAGNPYGIVNPGNWNYLYIVGYDEAKIYQIDRSAFEGTAESGALAVRLAIDVSSYLPNTPGLYHHGAALITLNAGSVRYIYALFTSATIDSAGYPDEYKESTVLRYRVNSDGSVLSTPAVVRVGKNATALIPVSSGGTVSILVPAIGGKQNYGSTNGTNSNLTQINAFGASLTASTRITGDTPSDPPLSANDNYDIRGVAVSTGGDNAYLLTVTYDANYLACWKLYTMNLAGILTHEGDKNISALITAGLLAPVNDSGFGVSGNYWEILYDNTVSGGRLWFLKGTPIRVSAGGNYASQLKLVDKPYDGSTVGNVNSADLIGEMLYQAAQGAALNTRLGTTRHLAKAVRAAKAAAEEEK
jgi:hypothetical protein